MRVPSQLLAASRAVTTPSPAANAGRSAAASSATLPTESVTLSGPAEAMRAAQAQVSNRPVRPDVVARIRADLAAGTIGTPADITATVDALLLELA